MAEKLGFFAELEQNSVNVDKIFGMHPDSEVRAMLEMLIRTEKLDATKAMVEYISRLNSASVLYAISICIREGGDVNAYTQAEGITGNMHMLVYSYIAASSAPHELFTELILLLLLSGSSPNKHAFHNNIMSPDHSYNNGETVLEYLRSKHLDGLISQVYPHTDRYTSRNVALLAGRIDLIDKFTVDDAVLSIKARVDTQTYNGTNIVTLFPDPDTGLDSVIIIEAIFNFDRGAAVNYIANGRNLSYPLTNIILINLASLINVKTLRTPLGHILGDAVDHGLELDSDQQAMLAATGEDLYKYIMDKYSIPYWKKHCRSTSRFSNTVSEKLFGLVESLGFASSKESICSFLNNIFLSNEGDIVRALINRQKARVGSRFGHINEFLTLTPPVLHVENLSDAYEYDDNYIVFHRDENARLWSWTSDSFEFLLKSRINPSTGLYLPESILAELQRKPKSKKPLKWKELISMITQPDVIDNRRTEHEIKMMNASIRLDLTGLTAADLSSIVYTSGYDYSLDMLTDSHALATFAYIYNYYTVNQPMVADTLVRKLTRNNKETVR